MVRVLLFGALRDRAGCGELTVPVDDAVTLSALLMMAEQHAPGLSRAMTELHVAIAVNADLVAGPDDGTSMMVRHGDEVALLPPFSGGAPLSSSIDAAVRCQAEPFSMEDEIAAVKACSTRIGAIVTMTGTVRDLSHGRAVMGIEVELYDTMARRRLEHVHARMIEDHGVLAARIIVRLGRFDVGDDLILIIAAAQHRREAFAAARWCIDEIKRSVPIWKRELTSDGWRWVHGC